MYSNFKDETKFCIGNLADSWAIKMTISTASHRIIYTVFPSEVGFSSSDVINDKFKKLRLDVF